MKSLPANRDWAWPTAGHPPKDTVPLRSTYNPNATPTKDVPGYGGDKVVSSTK